MSVDTLLTRLRDLGDRVRTDPEALERVGGDESGLPPGAPAAVILPESTAEVVQVAREAADLAVPLVPRGAGTGKAGACIPAPGQVVVDMSRMNRLLEVRPNDQYAVVQPGVITGDLDTAAAEVGFFYPPDPGSWESCQLGGNIATNAGGMRAVKYGVTQRYVWALELVLAGGDVLRVGRRSIKGVAGLDLTSLIVGSEGTLAFVTEATVHIIPKPAAVETAWLTFPDILAASHAGNAIFAAGHLPRIMEVLDRTALDSVRSVGDFAIPEGAGAALLVEMDGGEGDAFDDLLAVAEVATNAGATDSAIARSEKEREAMRRTRRLVSSSLKEHHPFKLSDDVAVPRSRMVEMLERTAEAAGRGGLRLCAYGHLGDGNLHLNLLCDTEAERELARGFRRTLLEIAIQLGGTISGEHGIGLAKRNDLSLEQSTQVIAWQRRLKATLDPRGILNPGKVF
jgi:glycolate oxidase